MNIDNYLRELKTKGIKSLDGYTEETLSKMLLRANHHYYNKQSIITDSIYDILKEYIETKYPNNLAIKIVGAPIEQNKVQLPYEMWSMDKIKPNTVEVDKFSKKYPGNKVISTK